MDRTSQHWAPPGPLPLSWQRAAMLGSLWAANEIVIGSFLHNVGFPLTGTFLASIGVVLLVAGARLWNDTGVIWRAGVICALMKSISPSAVILGPMVGILVEAFLLFAFSSLFRRSLAGFLLGGTAATLTPILQKIATILIAYGFDAARLYEALFTLIADRVQVTGVTAASALLWFIGLNALPGAGAALVGVRVARQARRIPAPGFPTDILRPGEDGMLVSVEQPYSLAALILHLLLIVGSLASIPLLPPVWAPILAAAYTTIVLLAYPALRPKFRRPRLWIEFGAVTLLAGILFGLLAPGGKGTWWTGLQSGLQMSARATLMVAAFSAIGIELRNPVVVDWFLRRGLGSVAAALHVAFRALPVMLYALDRQRHGIRHPLRSFGTLLAVMLRYLDQLQHTSPDRHGVFLLTGTQGSGKTTLLQSAAEVLRGLGVPVRGILSLVRTDGGQRAGYDVHNLATGETVPLCRSASHATGPRIGQFVFSPEGVRFGREALTASPQAPGEVLFCDEIGPLEMHGEGWAPAIAELLRSPRGPLVFVVRPGLVEDAQHRFGFTADVLWTAGKTPSETVVQALHTYAVRAQQESAKPSGTPL